MFQAVRIQGFRGLRDFSMENLGRINLLVGKNNCGKSSVLEGLELLSSRGGVRTLWNATVRRGERFWVEGDGARYSEGDVSRIFYGHRIDYDSHIEISARTSSNEESVGISVFRRTTDQMALFEDTTRPPLEPEEEMNLQIQWCNGRPKSVVEIPLSPRGGISSRNIMRRQGDVSDLPAIRFISTAALSIEEVLALFDEVVLTPEESFLVDALKTIEPSIERIASIGADRSRFPNSRQGGIVVKTSQFQERVPIGSMGDGMWRLLGIAVSLVNAENGVLLVDEIDTGLHYSVLGNMWRLVQETAERLNVQVFATTHSRDCYESLAEISRDYVSENSKVTIQRIEVGSERAVAFTEQEIVAASRRGIEVR
ncbi:MAG: AAA family ATPase [Pirellulaceae bacterium]|nr:AAA family ATPase [Pirellulaceae bacterium]